MAYTREEKAMIWLDSFPLDYAKKAALLKAARDPYALAARFEEFAPLIEEKGGAAIAEKMRASLCGDYMPKLLALYAESGISCVTCFSSLYPESLRAIGDPPFVLYCRGDTSLLGGRKFAIVGSRRTLPDVMKRTEKFAEALAGAFVIVTGLAEGGDTAALEGALKGGGAISVLAYGFSHVYPECNRALLEKAVKSGLALTEYVPWQGPKKYLFPARNRIIAGLSEGVLVVSGGMKSGTRITAERAYDYGRDVFAFPYGIGVNSAEGCNKFIKDYAKLTDDLVDITSVFGINLTEKEKTPLSDTERKVLACLGEGGAHVSEIAEKTGMREAELSPLLILLQMKNRVVSLGGNRWGKT